MESTTRLPARRGILPLQTDHATSCGMRSAAFVTTLAPCSVTSGLLSKTRLADASPLLRKRMRNPARMHQPRMTSGPDRGTSGESATTNECAGNGDANDVRSADGNAVSSAGKEGESDQITRLIQEVEGLMPALDLAMNEWIGSDLSRWEWYERLRTQTKRGLSELSELYQVFQSEKRELEEAQQREDRQRKQQYELQQRHLQQQQRQKTEAEVAATQLLSEMDDDEQQADADMDRLAESWIGSNLSRWEWYERLRSRRSKLSRQIARDSARFDEDMNKLRRLLLEVDEMLGTRMLDTKGDISPSGWLFLFTLTSIYISIGYGILHVLVGMLMSLMSFYHNIDTFL